MIHLQRRGDIKKSMSNIIKDIIKETQDYRYLPVTIVPGFFFDQWALINTIFFYYNSKFQTGDTDDEGDKKYFYNVVKNPCKIFSKSIDWDTKNIKLLTTGGGDPHKTWFMQRDLNFWMRDKIFGKILNRLFYELPIFGTVVLKVIDGTPYFVDLRNFIVDKAADSLDESNYITESHNMTVGEFRKTAKKMKWPQGKVDETIKKFRETKASHIIIYERYGEVEVDGKDKTYPYRRTFIADVGEDRYVQNNNGQILISERGVLLASEDWDGHPYWEFHAEKIPGRWLGVGVVETLIEPQIRHNELVNLQSKTSYWAALRVFQTRDPAINRNLKSDMRNGDVLNADSEVSQIDMSDRNLAFFNEETAKWNKNINDLTIAFAPIGHSVIAIQVALDQVVSYFEQIQENVALDVKEMLYEAIIPSFEKDMTAEHTLRLVGQDLDTYVEMVKNDLVNHEVVRVIVNSGKFPNSDEKEVIATSITDAIKQGKEKLLTVPKGFYSGLKYDIDIDITGESVDTKARSALKLSILQAITADPTMTTDPMKKKLLASYMEDAGISPDDFLSVTGDNNGKMNQQLSTRAGGGVSAPSPIQGSTGKMVTTV